MTKKNWTSEKLFTRLLTYKSETAHWDTIRELRSRAGKDIFEKACQLIRSTKVQERIIGAEILSQFGTPPRLWIKSILKLFFETLQKEKNAKVISTLLYGIGHNSEHLTRNDIAYICTWKNNQNIEVQQALVFALGGLDNTIALDTLISFTESKQSSIRDWATFGIGALSDKDNAIIRKALWNRLSDKHKATRQEAIFGLAKRKDLRVKDVLKKELEIIDHHGSYILEAIEVLGDRDFIELLQRKIVTNKKTQSINEDWLKDCVAKLKEIK